MFSHKWVGIGVQKLINERKYINPEEHHSSKHTHKSEQAFCPFSKDICKEVPTSLDYCQNISHNQEQENLHTSLNSVLHFKVGKNDREGSVKYHLRDKIQC